MSDLYLVLRSRLEAVPEWVYIDKDVLESSRKARGLSYETMARTIPVSSKSWERYEKAGRIPRPMLERVAEVLNLEIEEPVVRRVTPEYDPPARNGDDDMVELRDHLDRQHDDLVTPARADRRAATPNSAARAADRTSPNPAAAARAMIASPRSGAAADRGHAPRRNACRTCAISRRRPATLPPAPLSPQPGKQRLEELLMLFAVDLSLILLPQGLSVNTTRALTPVYPIRDERRKGRRHRHPRHP
jgi:transcriptional regulator with XRE-family HTH domain